jgi:hypothetical protein
VFDAINIHALCVLRNKIPQRQRDNRSDTEDPVPLGHHAASLGNRLSTFRRKMVPSVPRVLRYGILDHIVLKTSNLTDLKLCVPTAHVLTITMCKMPSVYKYRRKSQNPLKLQT